MASQLSERSRVRALFEATASDRRLRDRFVADPAQTLAEHVLGRRLEPAEAAAANQLVYAVVSNPGLARWLSSQGRGDTDNLDEDAFLDDLARVLASEGDEQTQLAVLRAEGEPEELFRVQADVLRSLAIARRGGHEGDEGGIDVEVTLQALVDLATELRQAGELNTFRFR